jgi:CRP-like cAMP-binding protein
MPDDAFRRNVYLEIQWWLNRESLELIEGIGEAVKYNPGECITSQGEEGNSMYLILEGNVRILRGGQLIAKLDRLRSFGEVSMLIHSRRMATVLADSPVRVLRISRENLERITREKPELAAQVYHLLAESLAQTLFDLGKEAVSESCQ